MSAFLELRGVRKGFALQGGGRREVLRDIDLSVEPGELVALVGFSGAGKTTLFSLIAGLEMPDAGEVLLDGRPVRGPGPDRGIVFQSYALLPWLTAHGNVALAVDQIFAEWPAAKRRGHVEKHLHMVGLAHARDKRPAELSGGMRQRVALARALAMSPQVLLLDEPLGALDALTRRTLQGEIARIHRESRKTTVLITNDVDEAILLADRVVTLGAGPPATLDSPIAIDLARPRDARALAHDARFQLLRAKVIEQLLASRKKLPSGVVSLDVALEAACARA